ncbi:hypothetical protein KUTeg_007237 [Tegillarca granosa]|uniref:Uncharacterized protein n=1 Tax=Tegillarca granosa TaxID=220873 RepID=A0ABQ9FGU4_TEGGR|nr:hypothetical protein KUTeg_007237 [Tegillarca granosa]
MIEREEVVKTKHEIDDAKNTIEKVTLKIQEKDDKILSLLENMQEMEERLESEIKAEETVKLQSEAAVATNSETSGKDDKSESGTAVKELETSDKII